MSSPHSPYKEVGLHGLEAHCHLKKRARKLFVVNAAKAVKKNRYYHLWNNREYIGSVFLNNGATFEELRKCKFCGKPKWLVEFKKCTGRR